MRRRYRLSYTRDGKQKYVLLYRRWKDLCNRCKRGGSTSTPHLYYGLEIGWKNYTEFRRWAIKNGFSKHTSSPDRQDARFGYVPDNVKWATIAENCSTRRSWQHMSGEDLRGPDPEQDNEIPFFDRRGEVSYEPPF